ncbi:hypothetical protein ACFPA8_07810 [Streptomyces ovatisporus]|uniref:Uncharacterized protein n=1 Tax=Streptomyces ovatisporus TaxID=1128682 RepID=A0ABV9A8Z9_9ACTN
MAYDPDLNEAHYRRIRPYPDDDPPTEWPWAPSTYADWITPALIAEVIE